jgi:hypothetical protein
MSWTCSMAHQMMGGQALHCSTEDEAVAFLVCYLLHGQTLLGAPRAAIPCRLDIYLFSATLCLI